MTGTDWHGTIQLALFVLTALLTILGGIWTGLLWRVYDRVVTIDRILAAVVQKLGGVDIE